MPLYPPLPLYALFRGVDYDSAKDQLLLTPRTPYLSLKINDKKCLPLFTSRELASAFAAGVKARVAIVECSPRRLLQILATTKPPRVTLDPSAQRMRGDSYPTKEIIKWLKMEVNKEAN